MEYYEIEICRLNLFAGTPDVAPSSSWHGSFQNVANGQGYRLVSLKILPFNIYRRIIRYYHVTDNSP